MKLFDSFTRTFFFLNFHRFIETEIVEKDGFFDIFYLLPETGTYDVDVKFGGKQIPEGLMRMTVK